MRRAVLPFLVLALVVGVGFYIYSINAGPPSRINWCARDYDASSQTQTLAEVMRDVDSTIHDGALREVARSPWGYAVMAAPLSPAQQASLHTPVCAMVVYIRLSSDNYLPYELSGGP